MAGLESITIHYLPGAERFLHERGQSLVVDIQSEGIFSSGVRISNLREAPADEDRAGNQRHQHHTWPWEITLMCITLLGCCIWPAWVVGKLMLSPQAWDPPSCQGTGGHMFSSETIIFPLSADISDLLRKTVQLATDVTFLGLSRHQTHRLLPGTTDSVDAGNDELRFERLWSGSLFNSATVPVVQMLCNIVTDHETADSAWTPGIPPPEVLAKEELTHLCQNTLKSLQEADQAWHEARPAVGNLVLGSVRRSRSLGAAFKDAELYYNDAHPPPWGGQPMGSSPGGSPQMDYSDPVWQSWVANITLEELFPLGLPPLLVDTVGPRVSALRNASAMALSNLASLEMTISTWLYGVTGGEASRCDKFPLRQTFLRYLCFCTWGEPDDIRQARELIHLVSKARGHVLVATQQAEVATQMAHETESGWEGLQGALQTVRDGSLHNPKVQGPVQVEPNLSSHHGCAQQHSSPLTAMRKIWIFETLDQLGETVSAAAVYADLRWQWVRNYEQALWKEGPSDSV